LEEASKQPFSQNSQGATAMLIGKRQPDYPQQQPHRRTQTSSSKMKEAVQSAAYRMVHIAVHEEMSSQVPLLDASFVVHTLQQEDSRQFRCDVYGEVVQWDVASDDRPALQLMMGLHDMWSRVLVQNGGREPWWMGDSIQAVSENQIKQRTSNMLMWSTQRRRLQGLTAFRDHHEEHFETTEESRTESFVDKTVDNERLGVFENDVASEDGDATRSLELSSSSRPFDDKVLHISVDDAELQQELSRRLENVEEALPEQGDNEIDGQRQAIGKEPLNIKDGFGDLVPREGDAIVSKGDEFKAPVVEEPASGDEGTKDEDNDDQQEEKSRDEIQEEAPVQDNLKISDSGKASNSKVGVQRLQPLNSESSSSRETWMGVLSSTPIHYFVRIVPPSLVGVIYLEEQH
jgi:hypothetical protein